MLRRLIGLPRTPGVEALAGSDPVEPGSGRPNHEPADADAAATGSTGSAGDWTRGSASETATVREIVARLKEMPVDQARFLAGFAYILGRTAMADLHVTEDETRRMEEIVVEHGKIPEAQAVIVVQIARTRAELFGPTEDYLVTREFRALASDEQCLDVLRCCFLVGAADGVITAEESGTLGSIADELGVAGPDVRQLRAEFAEQSAALQAMRKARQG